jgi:hypothetical protein
MNQAVLNRARNDKFLLVLDLPKYLKGKLDPKLKEYLSIDNLQYTCYGSPVPSITIPSIDIPFGGQTLKISSHTRPSYQGLTIPFVLSNGWKNYWILWKWLNLFNDYKNGISMFNYTSKDKEPPIGTVQNSMLDFVSSITTYALDEYNKRIMSFKYTHAFPTALSEVNFSHQDPTEIMSKVTFSFNQVHVDILKDVDSPSDCL